MPIQYNVDSNLLTDPPSHYPRVAAIATLDLDDVADLINLHNPNVPSGTAKMCIDLFIEEVKTQLAEGNWVKLDNFCSFSTSIVNGSLENPGDTLPGTAKVELRFKPSVPFKIGVQELATFERLGYTNKTPQIVGVRDVSLALNKIMTANNAFDITGSNIGFNTSAADEGIFMLTDGGSETKISNIARNKPSNVIVIPSFSDSADGETATIIYSRSRYTTNGQLKQGAFQYARITNTVVDPVFATPCLKPYGSAAVAEFGPPSADDTLLLTAKVNTEGQAIIYGQDFAGGVPGVVGDEVTVETGINVITIDGQDYNVTVADVPAFTAMVIAEGRFMQELIDIVIP